MASESSNLNAEELQARIVAIVTSSDDAIVSKDLNGIVQSWNAGAERIFGYTAQEIIGKPILTIVPKDLHQQESDVMARLERGERIEHLETVRRKKSGENIHVSVTISPIRDDHGRVVGAAKIARDITQRKKTEEALLTSEKLASVGRMAATIAHEINNPLEAVVNLIYLARQFPELPRESDQFLHTADDELSRVSHIVKQTLGFYRETAAPSPFAVADVINGMLLVYGSKIRSRKISIQVEVPEQLTIDTVVGEFRQVLANIFQNALEAVSVGGVIRVRVSKTRHGSADAVRVTVADNGPGINALDLRRIFDPFFTTKKDLGTGLGLWVSKGIVEKHGGHLQVRSSTNTQKSWTVFSLVWPASVRTRTATLSFQSRRQQA